MNLIKADIPWTRLEAFLNDVVVQNNMNLNIANRFPHSAKVERPLTEDYVRQGLLYGRNYTSQEYLDEAKVDSDEQAIEALSMATQRKQRMFYLAREIASVRSPSYAWYTFQSLMLHFFYRKVNIWTMMRDHPHFELQTMPKGFCTETSLLFQISKTSSTNPIVTCPSLNISKIWQYTRRRALNCLRYCLHSP